MIIVGFGDQMFRKAEVIFREAAEIVRQAKDGYVVAGGGAIEMELSKIIREYSSENHIGETEQSVYAAVAVALKIIPRQLCINAGLDATNILEQLSQNHEHDGEFCRERMSQTWEF